MRKKLFISITSILFLLVIGCSPRIEKLNYIQLDRGAYQLEPDRIEKTIQSAIAKIKIVIDGEEYHGCVNGLADKGYALFSHQINDSDYNIWLDLLDPMDLSFVVIKGTNEANKEITVPLQLRLAKIPDGIKFGDPIPGGHQAMLKWPVMDLVQINVTLRR
ncbi:hypothetical protein PVA45_07045 [Entomospira entomophila]|uniref:Uncharacterized protein n=1 Tax=Entomospira entomophila TaxID=2719988 RepID=A0A968GB32_9SPIO|nr:hypothetical protein [Entomospira entomophilus]NIZ41257.1 hypothetical protein [Entomospira entomophilus]WDI35462.1 hypothetical protein PVA45_07045 [Entomospira entomophilus]